MTATTCCGETAFDVLDWARVTRCLVARAVRRRLPLPPDELASLAGLALAKANAYYAADRATCSLRQWAYSQGWRLLLSEVRDEVRRRRRSARAVTFTDLAGPRAEGDLSHASLPALARPHRHDVDVRDLLARLTPAERNIVLLRIEGWTHQQIARRCGVSRETVRLRLSALRAVFRREEIAHA